MTAPARIAPTAVRRAGVDGADARAPRRADPGALA
ncbi:hypothetical protein EV187_2501 [Agromyces ramosus]|uniref:Uncharacterized protein n=1 Tax=Agromyces ramosus TaxID=33879 RepID=A0A4Q7MBM7_9MICO|nr:hypothetical protein EV187_2501 [Agromyces ramosus]